MLFNKDKYYKYQFCIYVTRTLLEFRVIIMRHSLIARYTQQILAGDRWHTQTGIGKNFKKVCVQRYWQVYLFLRLL